MLDPCEKEKTDASGELTDQEREDLTAGAQVNGAHAIRHWNVLYLIAPVLMGIYTYALASTQAESDTVKLSTYYYDCPEYISISSFERR